jgi:hypothetical protein
MNMQKPTAENQRGLKAPVYKTVLPVGPISFQLSTESGQRVFP